MIASFLIIGFSVLLFLYWFRYTCLLILRAKTTRDYAEQVATANQLRFREVQSELSLPAADHFDALRESLDRDYRVLSCLLQHAAEFEVRGYRLEQGMLKADYLLMKVWYALTRRIARSQARLALEEMTFIVGHFANTFGERAAYSTRA